MQKIKDRMLLGLAAGLGANVIKLTLDMIFGKLNWAEISSSGRAAGMLVPPHTLAKMKGKTVGYLADAAIAGVISTASVYAFSILGKDKAVIKGALTGQVTWTSLYGILGTMGATKVSPVSPSTVLCEFISHTAFGATSAFLITKLGDSGLFNGTIPLSVSPSKVQQDNKSNGNTAGIMGQSSKLNAAR